MQSCFVPLSTEELLDIRPYRKEDLGAVSLLIQQLGYDIPLESLRHNLSTFLNFPENQIFVVDINDKIVGYVALAIHHMIVVNFNRCRIENLVVNQKHRRKGIARALLNYTEHYALSKKVSILDVSSSLKRKNGHVLYKTLGYDNGGREERAYFRKRIQENT